MTDENILKALGYLETALKVAEELNDMLSVVLANNIMGHCLSANGEFAKALSCYEKALGINVMVNVRWGIVALKTNIVLFVHSCQGNAELSYQTSHEALRIADESGDIFSMANAHLAHGCSYYLKGFLDKAEEHLLKSSDLLQKSNQLAHAAGSSAFLGTIYLNRREYETSQEHYKSSISLYRHCSALPSYIILNKIAIVLAKVMNKERDINLNEIFKWFEDIKINRFKGLASNLIGKILLNIVAQHISEAEDWIKRSIETNQKHGMMWYLAQDYALYAEFYKRKGDPSNARESLNKAIEIFTECGADGWVERYEKELASLS
jgi:tetratricopeptide (TPR) repeat protein